MAEHWVVVGAGSGGCVAAARLSENPDRSVTLLEAGPPASLDDLGLRGRTFPDLRAMRSPGRVPDRYSAGRGIGGSSAVNAMLALRGDPEQYAAWGWSDVDDAWDRVAIPVELPSYDQLGVIDRALLASAPDARRVPLTRRDGARVTSADAYLTPNASRANLTVRSDSSVERVLLDGRRVAVVALADGREIPADRVVVAAGAMHTPALLLRSLITTPGIGRGLQDHASVSITLELRDGPVGRDGLLASTVLERGDLQVLSINHTADGDHAALAVALMRPVGRSGRVTIEPGEPGGEPLVELDLFGDERDLRRLRSGVRLLLELLERDPFREIVADAYIDEFGTRTASLTDDASIDRWLPSAPWVYAHATSTCAIGTVLDEVGAVLGYEGLYVCDASAFPSVPATNPHLPTTMLAERLSSRW